MTSNEINQLLPNGFRYAGVIAGLKQEHKKDLGLIYAEKDAAVGAVYTRNRFPSAHVQYCRQLTPGNRFRAIIINSGNANAATGTRGLAANLKMAQQVAQKLNLEPEQVLTSSTGIIGHPFPIEVIESSLDSLIDQLGASPTDTAEAIMTTDTHPKQAFARFEIEGSTYAAVGFAKGSGMIHPNMGTMLAYIMTDAPVSTAQIQHLAQQVADRSFNCVSVDGDTSTNDSFFLISSQPAELTGPVPPELQEAITQVAISLSKQIAADGEGAQHLIEVTVQGTPNHETAQPVLNAVLTSNLVKTAINGKDPNWGRILMAIGNGLNRTSLTIHPPTTITMQDTTVFHRGEPQLFDETDLSNRLAEHDVTIVVDLHQGDYSLTGWGCDFSEEYVRINADYST
ncbi:MAG: bifunctional glutamate N-acetyltransferase/amino-acid acetyltransferase ArgJ [bacterium]